jgi:hypothetical protein
LDVTTCRARNITRKEREMTDEQREQFEALARPLMDWLCANGNPHMSILIDSTSAQLVSGEIGFSTTEYLRD